MIRTYARPAGARSLLVLVSLVFAASTARATLPGTTFDAFDGNMTVEGAETDWDTPPPNLAVDDDQPTGQTDDSLGQGAKEDKPVPNVVNGSIPNNKSDLTHFYFASETPANGHPYLYLGWTRANTLGTANLDFEFNQSETLTSNGTTPVRTAGDILITFDFEQGGTTPVLGLATWLTSLGAGDSCIASKNAPCWGNFVNLSDSGAAEGSVNFVSTTDEISGGTLAPLTFGEAAIDLFAAGVLGLNPCNPFASAFVKSRSSTSFTAELKDFIAPIDISINQCLKVITLVCRDGANTLVQGTVNFYNSNNLSGTADTKNTLTSSGLPAGLSQSDVCSLGGAAYGGLQPATTKSETIVLPTLP